MMAVCKDSEQHVATLIPMIFDNATVGLRLGLGFRTFSGEIHHLDQKRLGSLFDWRYAGFGGAFSLGYGGYASVSWKAREEGEHGSKVKVNLYGGNVGFDLGAGVSGFQLSEVDFFIENWWIYEAAYRQYRMKEAALGWSEPLLSAKVMVAKEHQEHYQGPRFFASWVKYFPHSEDLGSDAQGRQLFAVARRIGQSAAGKMVFVKSTPSH
jgi:hypothetical protein